MRVVTISTDFQIRQNLCLFWKRRLPGSGIATEVTIYGLGLDGKPLVLHNHLWDDSVTLGVDALYLDDILWLVHHRLLPLWAMKNSQKSSLGTTILFPILIVGQSA